ncbi:MAG: amidohydrolase family protein [Oscillospiraceae bacterium]
MLDLIIRGASIIDGTGRAAYTGDAAVSDGRIAAVGELGAAEAARVIEARGRCLTPGFIDIHRHADAAVFRPGWDRAELAQGLTTVINSNCGLSLAPVRGLCRETLSLSPSSARCRRAGTSPTWPDISAPPPGQAAAQHGHAGGMGHHPRLRRGLFGRAAHGRAVPRDTRPARALPRGRGGRRLAGPRLRAGVLLRHGWPHPRA